MRVHLWLVLLGLAVRPGAADEADSTAVRPLSARAFTDALSYISDDVLGPDRNTVPGVRPRPLLEIGDPFQGQGQVSQGWRLPTGAVWSPSLLLYGTYRTAMQSFDNGGPGRQDRTEWVHRLDVFTNLRLSATERLVFGLRPFDNPDRAGDVTGSFTGYEFEPHDGRAGGFKERFDGTVSTLFFEGDFGELFPGLDPSDEKSLDVGFTVGRQPIIFQNGIIINGTLDAFGLTRNSLRWFGASNIRIAGLYATPNVVDPSLEERIDLFGLFHEVDTAQSTVEVDLVYRNARAASGNGLFLGIGATQRLGHFNTSFRYNLSLTLGRGRREIPTGHLFTAEVSLDLAGGSDVLYLNAYAGIDAYTSAFRDADAGGAVGRIGILFASPGIGRYGAALNPDPKRSLGGALGYQMFFNQKRTQLIAELGGRASTADGTRDDAVAGALRVQQALFNRVILLAEGFVGKRESFDVGFGSRFEVIVKF